jgi:hypothetical protein
MTQRRTSTAQERPRTPTKRRRTRSGCNTWLIFACAVACLVALASWRLVYAPESETQMSDQTPRLNWNALIFSSLRTDPRFRPPGTTLIVGPPTISAARIDEILRLYNSPAAGTGQFWIDEGLQYNINPVFALAFFMHESNLATNPEWSGWKDDGSSTHNVGNIICAEYSRCYGRFRDYRDWQTGIHDWYRLIADEYISQRGLTTVETIVPVYAPESENDVAGYIASVVDYAHQWSAP